MAEKVTLPLLGQTMEEGTIIKWFKQEGETVEKEEPLLEVMTDKANMEVESPVAGTLLKIVAQPDETVPVKGLIAIIGASGENIDALLAETSAPGPAAAAAPQTDAGNGQSAPAFPAAAAAAAATPAPADGGRISASPRARKLAADAGLDLSVLAGKGSGPGGRIIEKDVLRAVEEQKAAPAAAATPLARKAAADAGVDLAALSGTGPGGKIQRADVEAAASAAAAVPEPALAPRVSLGKLIPFSGLRKAVADNLEKSARSVIPVTLTLGVDMSETFRLREQVRPLYQERYGVKLGYTDIIVKATARAIEEFPILNSSLEGSQIRVHDSVNIGVAVALPDGLMAPVVKDANLKPLWSISAEIRDLAERAKSGKIGGADLTGGTFTVTNLGSYGIEQFNAIINPPQAAILAVCAIKEQPVVVNHEVVARPMMNLCLTFDHRIIDGAPAAAYLARLQELLQQPYLILA